MSYKKPGRPFCEMDDVELLRWYFDNMTGCTYGLYGLESLRATVWRLLEAHRLMRMAHSRPAGESRQLLEDEARRQGALAYGEYAYKANLAQQRALLQELLEALTEMERRA